MERNLSKALAYIGLLVLFTYTPVVLAGISENVSFWDSYVKSQGSFLGLFVNIGLLLLLVIDYEPGQSMIPRKMLTGTIFVIMLTVVIAGLAYNCRHRHIDLIWMLDKSWFVLFLHVMFVICLISVKYITLDSCARDLRIKEKF